MLAPLQWHDYRRKYGKLGDFVSSHPELFLIKEDYNQLREGAQGIIVATAAMAKVAAAAAASSPYSSLFPPVAVTPMAAHTARAKKLSALEQSGAVRLPAESSHQNGAGYVSRGLSNVKILSKSKDHLELHGPEMRSHRQLLIVATENGAHSDRSILGNPHNQVPFHVRGSANCIAKPQGRLWRQCLSMSTWGWAGMRLLFPLTPLETRVLESTTFAFLGWARLSCSAR